jgi:hypothetical protein
MEEALLQGSWASPAVFAEHARANVGDVSVGAPEHALPQWQCSLLAVRGRLLICMCAAAAAAAAASASQDAQPAGAAGPFIGS